MSATYNKTDGTSVKLSKVKAIIAIPYTDANTIGDVQYRFDNVLRDSTSLTQDDPETSNIENEVSDSPILTSTKLGSWNFSSTINDVQPMLLKQFCGYSVKNVGNESSPKWMVAAPKSYNTVYAKVIIVLDNAGKNVALIVPKLQLNSKMTVESLSNNMVGFSLAGVAQNGTHQSIECPFCIEYDFTLENFNSAITTAAD